METLNFSIQPQTAMDIQQPMRSIDSFYCSLRFFVQLLRMISVLLSISSSRRGSIGNLKPELDNAKEKRSGERNLWSFSIQTHSDIQQPVQSFCAFRQFIQIPILQRLGERVGNALKSLLRPFEHSIQPHHAFQKTQKSPQSSNHRSQNPRKDAKEVVP
jgi:hypothetical protein